MPSNPERTLHRAAPVLVALLFWAYYLVPFVARPDLWIRGLVAVPGLLAIAALGLRGRRPLLVVVVTGACLLVSPGAAGAVFVAQAGLARRTPRIATVLAAATGLVLAKAVQLLLLSGAPATARISAIAFEFTVLTAGVVIATLAGRLARSRAEEAASRTESERARRAAEQARLAEARLAERSRIAREMHDVVAHRISLVALRAGVLAHSAPDPSTRDEARLIQSTARDALAELRVVLADLRGPDAPPEPPQPTLADLPVLVAEARSSGQVVAVDLGVAAEEVPTRISRQAYRIVQEGLTNARRHAPGAPVSIAVTGRRGERLAVEITNPVTDLAPPDTTGAGLGLVGIAERADLLGGSMSHGIRAGSFELTASLPWTEAA
jgi:signal transduction histidine kinase